MNLATDITDDVAPDLGSYDHIIVGWSGGKDSLACILDLIERGVDMTKVELWHHDVDGREGSSLMDWPVTPSYCRKVAEHLNLPLWFSWKQGGFEGEMNRDNQATAPTSFEAPNGDVVTVGGTGPKGTRLKFPQVSADLSVRWCSAYLKIDICAKAINNQKRFDGKRTLVVTGERAEESPARAKYKMLEPHKSNAKKRTVDQWRPIKWWTEQEVWSIMKRHGIVAHPAYFLGWGRLSCATCIFGNPDQWASAFAIMPEKVARIMDYEEERGTTIQRHRSVREMVEAGNIYNGIIENPVDVENAISTEYTGIVHIDPIYWVLPAGAYGDKTGPV